MLLVGSINPIMTGFRRLFRCLSVGDTRFELVTSTLSKCIACLLVIGESKKLNVFGRFILFIFRIFHRLSEKWQICGTYFAKRSYLWWIILLTTLDIKRRRNGIPKSVATCCDKKQRWKDYFLESNLC